MAKLNGRGKGKWHSGQALQAYRIKRNRLNKIAAMSRRKNRN